MISSPVEEIKNRLDIVGVIGNYIKLQKAGANFRAVCPFHSEKKPSFFVSPARQIWHCFGCNSGGDIFKFVMQIEGVEFGDALRLLAQKAGVQLKKPSPEYKKWQTERTKLYDICELACRFFEKQLEEGSTGKEAQKYLLGRGLTPESIKKWRIGYSPDVWQSLSDFLTSRGYQKEEIQKAGLALTSEKGSFYDRFRGRIIFPICDLNSQVVGFGGRIFKSDDPAKYLNTPNTLLYDKSRILYGLAQAKVEIRKKNFCILVEGYIDEILVSQSGNENVVATSGTALTAFQLQILKRYSENLHTAFDMDVAGDNATKRGIDLAQIHGFNIKVITMPPDKDPADIVSQNPKQWEDLLRETKSITEFYFETTFSRFDRKSPEGKREISKILLPVIKRIPNKIEQSHWIQLLSQNLSVKEELVEDELKKIKTSTGREEPLAPTMTPEAKPKSRKEILEERIATLVLKNPPSLNLIDQDLCSCFSPLIQTAIADFKEGRPSDFLNYLAFRAEIDEEDIDRETEIKTCLRELKCLEVKNKMDGISQELKKAEEEKKADKINDLIKKFKDTANELTNLMS